MEPINVAGVRLSPLVVMEIVADIIRQMVAYERSLNRELVRFVFFFQAEDGIRDHCVTGVQTCALPISVLELDVGVAGSGRTIRVVGLDILRAALVQPQLAGGERFDLLSPETVMLSATAADAFGLGTGDKLQLVVGQRRVVLRVVGILPSSAVQGIAAVTDIATAQWRLGRLGELNRIDIRLSHRKNQEEMRKTIQGYLPPGVHVSAIESLEESSATPSRSYRVNLNVRALIALFTGGFLVFSAQALEAARRRGEHALLRVLGLTRWQLARLVLP